MKKILFICFIILTLLSVRTAVAAIGSINNGENIDTIYFSNISKTTKLIDFNASFDVKTMIFQFDISYDTLVFIFDSQSLSQGFFLTANTNPITDTFMLIIFNDSKTGNINITGARMVIDNNNKGLQGFYQLISSIKFIINDTNSAPGKTFYLKNFKFADANRNTFTASSLSFSWEVFQKILNGDINLDGIVNSVDISFFRRVYNKKTEAAGKYKDADLNEDGNIDSFDFTAFKQNFGKR